MTQEHWDNIYQNNKREELGWYQDIPSPDLQLIERTDVGKNDRVLLIGAGVTTLIDKLVEKDYTNLIATDISQVALNTLKANHEKASLKLIQDDLTNPQQLKDINQVALWHDRAVLHFLTDEQDRKTYSSLLRNKIKSGGYVILGQFSTEGANRCSGLDVYQYDLDRYRAVLGDGFELIHSEYYTYSMPNGQLRPYIYAIYKRV